MHDVTRWYVQNDSLIRVTWLVHMCDITRLCVRHDVFRVDLYKESCTRRDSLICETRLVHVCDMTFCMLDSTYDPSRDMTGWNVWRDPLTYALICVCDALTCVCDSLICAKWLVHTCDKSCRFVRMQHHLFTTVNPRSTHCNTLQHPATHCNTLPYTATHCNALQATCCIQMCDIWLIRLWPADQIRRFVDYTSDRLVRCIRQPTPSTVYIHVLHDRGG